MRAQREPSARPGVGIAHGQEPGAHQRPSRPRPFPPARVPSLPPAPLPPAPLPRGARAQDELYGSSGAFTRTLKALRVGGRSGAAIFAELAAAGALQLRVLGRALPPAELARLHRASDLYASPYRGEGFNMPVLEAAACGLPLLVTAGGATDDFTRPAFALYARAERRVGETGADQGMEGRAVHLEPDAEHVAQLLLAAARDAVRGGGGGGGGDGDGDGDGAGGSGEDGDEEDGGSAGGEGGRRATERVPRGWMRRAGPAAARFVREEGLTWRGVAERLAREWEGEDEEGEVDVTSAPPA